MKKLFLYRYFPVLIAVMAVTLLVRIGGVAERIERIAGDTRITLNTANAESKEVPADKKAEDKKTDDKKADDKAENAEDHADSAEEEEVATDIPEDDEKRPPSEVTLLQQLNEQRDNLAKQETALNSREALLKAAEIQFQQKLSELNQLKAQIEDLLKKAENRQEEQMGSLVKIYETMKPKDAAKIFDTLETNVLLDLTGRMKESKLALILASMNPDRARQVTTELAARAHKIPKTEPVAPASPAAATPAAAPAAQASPAAKAP